MNETQKVLHLDVEFVESTQTFEVEMLSGSGSGGRLPYYTGSYSVEPRKVSQTLETAGKSMRENLVVNEIYYSETSNLSGGYTAYIGVE